MSELPKCPKCNSQHTYEDGALFVCPECAHEWSGDAAAADDDDGPRVVKDAVGNVLADELGAMVDRSVAGGFGPHKQSTLPRYCQTCEVRDACWGGCPKHRFAVTPNGEPGLHYLCAGYKDFFSHVDGPMRVMASLLRQGRDATGLRDWYAVRDAKGRFKDIQTYQRAHAADLRHF